MTDHDTLYAAIETQRKILDKQTDDIEFIKATISTIAVQEEKITTLKNKVNALDIKYDKAFAPDGVVMQVLNHQAGCPAPELKRSINQLWTTIWTVTTLIVMLIAGMKLWG